MLAALAALPPARGEPARPQAENWRLLGRDAAGPWCCRWRGAGRATARGCSSSCSPPPGLAAAGGGAGCPAGCCCIGCRCVGCRVIVSCSSSSTSCGRGGMRRATGCHCHAVMSGPSGSVVVAVCRWATVTTAGAWMTRIPASAAAATAWPPECCGAVPRAAAAAAASGGGAPAGAGVSPDDWLASDLGAKGGAAPAQLEAAGALQPPST